MSYCECNCFEQKLAYHTAPALLGIKPASLFSICEDEINDKKITEFNAKAGGKGLKIRVMCKCKNRKLIMLYSWDRIAEQLHREENAVVLRQYGYNTQQSLDEMLERLSVRIQNSNEFPHEIGVFLGYPIEDVRGFIENSGDNFKLCGYWKVYGDTEKAKRTFKNYDKCRVYLCNKLSQGTDIYQALKIS